MSSNRAIQWSFVILLGIILPLALHVYPFEDFTLPGILIAHLYSIAAAYLLWNGSRLVNERYRNGRYSNYVRVIGTCIVAIGLSSLAVGVLDYIYIFFGEDIKPWKFGVHVFAETVVVLIALLVSEMSLLTTEKEQERSRTAELDHELTRAQLTVLKNELDPHFIYNALNTLSWLVKKDTDRAEEFISKLSDIYKYFLTSKTKESVSLAEELQFINDYFFLLQLRYENKIRMTVNIEGYDPQAITILPCALQILVENAIKHNAFSEARPLSIKISIAEDNIYVVNTRMPGKIPPHYSTKVGLSNLKARYELAYKKPIVVDSGGNQFVVRLPLLKSA